MHRISDFTTLYSVEKNLASGPGPAITSPAGLSRARRGVWETLAQQPHPATIAQIVELTGLHENTIREHLWALLDEGLVTRRQAPAEGRGRPAWLWQAIDRSVGAQFAGLLSVMAHNLKTTSTTPAEEGYRLGIAWGHKLSQDRPTDPHAGKQERYHQALALLAEAGFAPRVEATSSAANSNDKSNPKQVTLTRCPLLSAAVEHPEVVCAMHQGLIEGSFPQPHPAAVELELIPFGATDGCVLYLREESA